MENRERICFVIMGFGKKQDPYTNRTIDLDATYNKIIQPSVVACGYKCIRADEILDSGTIDRSMYALLYKADLVLQILRQTMLTLCMSWGLGMLSDLFRPL